ncbi:hypothetical protein D3C76_794270 [compost metagenome]
MQGPGQFRCGGAIHRSVVGLGENGEAALGDALDVVEAFDDVHLPGCPGKIHGAGMDTRHHDAELAPVARFGQREMANVEVDVEQVVFHPIGITETEGHLDDLALEHRRDVQALGNMLDDLPKAEALPLYRGLIVDVDHGAVRRGMRTIDFQEQGV